MLVISVVKQTGQCSFALRAKLSDIARYPVRKQHGRLTKGSAKRKREVHSLIKRVVVPRRLPQLSLF